MRSIFRELTLRLSLAVLALALAAAGVMVWALAQLDLASRTSGERWGLVLLGASVTGLVVALISTRLARAQADRAAESVASPLRLLAQRTDEMTAGGFALDPQARPGRLVELDPWQAGITEIDALAREIDRHHQTLARSLVSERSFAADASHQLRTPLAALLLRLEEIARLGEQHPAVRAEAEIAIAQVERLSGVVDDLLRRTRAGHASGGARCAVDAVLAALLDEWEPVFEEQGRELGVRADKGLIVEASDSTLTQVLHSLLENALTHGDGAVSVAVVRSGPSAVFTVSDRGAGVPAHLERDIFERAVTTGPGTGLGLAMAREAAEAVGGRLELTQARPPIFALYLPLALHS